MKTFFFEFNDFLRRRFPDFKVQKIALDAGFTCPNRDGTKGIGGCDYCNNRTFNPAYCHHAKNISAQLEEGKRFFARKYPEMKYLAYFQAYSNTYADVRTLRQRYEEALDTEGVAGLIISTRPDCVPDEILDCLAELGRRTFLMVEYGIESTLNATLQRINRHHTYEEAESAVRRTAERQIPVGAHVILGLPGESRAQMLQHADNLSRLPLLSLKLHQLQIIRGTRMAAEYTVHPENFHLFTPDEYINLVGAFIRRLRSDIYMDRFVAQAPDELLIAPRWGLKNHAFADKIRKLGDRIPTE
jgi:radical SAM protein (TIGR01212 family)